MSPAGVGTEGSEQTVVIIEASREVAAAAHRIGWQTVFVQLPKGPVEELLAGLSRLYSVDYHKEAFGEFTERVVAPLSPVAVVTMVESAHDAAELANRVLGVQDATALRMTQILRDSVHT